MFQGWLGTKKALLKSLCAYNTQMHHCTVLTINFLMKQMSSRMTPTLSSCGCLRITAEVGIRLVYKIIILKNGKTALLDEITLSFYVITSIVN